MSHPRLSAAEAAELLREQGYAYLDVRTEAEFAIEHAQGAYNVPWRLADSSGSSGSSGAGGEVDNPDFLAVVSALFTRDAGLVVGCHTGERSQRAAAALLAAGWSCVVEQRAGHAGRRDAFGRVLELGWAAAGLPCESEPEAGRDYAALRARARA